MAEVDCQNTRPPHCPDDPAALGKAIAIWAKKWQKWWDEAEAHLKKCPGVKVEGPEITHSICRAMLAIHKDWCSWAVVLQKTEQACCPGPTGHIPPPPPPPF